MADRWLKVNCLLSSAIAFWLVGLSPLPNICKGISYGLSLVASVQMVQETKRLMAQEARRTALSAMNQELEELEITLHTHQQEQALHEVYGASTYSPEVEQELRDSLEHLYKEPSADAPSELPSSTSNDKAFYLAVKSLLEVKGESFVIEKIFKRGGRNWADGKRWLKEILDHGEASNW